MKYRGLWRHLASAAAVLALAGCGTHQGRPRTTHAPPAGPAPQPPAGMAAGLALPEPDGNGQFVTINSGLSTQEALWHLRAALNVAALSCRHQPTGSTIVARYNSLLTRRKAVLAAAYAAEAGRFRAGGPGALDAHMTKLYNFFAQPSAQTDFCATAAEIADRAAATPANALPQFAPGALGRLEAPILDHYRAYASYRRELAAWNARQHRVGSAGGP